MASGDATTLPVKNQAYRVTFPIFDADGDLVTAAGSLDSERSLDGGTFADCTSEATEIATSSGMYYLDLNASEMNADTVAIIVKSTSGKTTPIVLYPADADINDIYSDTTVIESDTTAIETDTGNIYSDTTIIYSDTTVIEASGGGLTAGQASDLAAVESELIVVHSETTALQADTANIYSDTTIIYSDTTVIETDTGNIYSDTAVVESDTTAIHTQADAIFEILTSAGGSATSDGAVDGTTIIDSAQTGANDLYNALAIKITSGLYNGQVRTIKDWDLGGTTFTLTRGFGGQIVTGVTYRVVSATVYQPGITLVPSSAATVEPDTLETISIAITTNAGAPTTGEITPGTITIARIRAGASTNIVVAAACSEAAGNIYYAYTFPAASWQAGDYYLATMSGQEIEANGITYPLSTIPFQGYVTREASIVSDIAIVDANVDSILSDTAIIESDTTAIHTQTTAIESELIVVHSETTVVQSDTTAIETDTGNIYSDTTIIYSDTTAIHSETTAIQSDAAAVESELIVVHSETTVIQSDTTAIESEVIVIHSETTAIQDDTQTSGVAIAAATQQAIADEMLKRGVSNVEDTADTTSLAAIILAILESSISGTTWTIRKTGGTTFVTKTVTVDSDANPITGVT
jgi:hypothetical protein